MGSKHKTTGRTPEQQQALATTLSAFFNVSLQVKDWVDAEIKAEFLGSDATMNLMNVDTGEGFRRIHEVLIDTSPTSSIRIVQFPAMPVDEVAVHVRKHEYNAETGEWGGYDVVASVPVRGALGESNEVVEALYLHTPIRHSSALKLAGIVTELHEELRKIEVPA